MQDGRATVYLYSPQSSGLNSVATVSRNGSPVVHMEADYYFVDYPEPGEYRYSTPPEDADSWRWSMEGRMFRPAKLRIEAGKVYYLRVIDERRLLRVDSTTGSEEINRCRLIPRYKVVDPNKKKSWFW